MISLKDEMIKLVADNFDRIIVRHKTNIKCNCWREASNTPDPNCSRCQGLGWIFEEFMQKCKFFLVDSQRVSHMQDYNFGKSYSNAFTLYIPVNHYTKKIHMDDVLYSIATSEDGKIIKPLKRLRRWVVTDCIPQHMENGRLEFIQVLAKPLDL